MATFKRRGAIGTHALLMAAGTVLAGVATAGTATAAGPPVPTTPGVVDVNEASVISYTAWPDRITKVSVTEMGSGREHRYLVEVKAVDRIPAPGRGCVSAGGSKVLCTSAYDTGRSATPTSIRVTLGTKDDSFYNGTMSTPAYVRGGPGADTLQGAGGADYLYGDAGDDVLYGVTGDDELSGDDGADSLYGDEGDDRLVGGAGPDTLTDEFGNNSLIGGDGRDRLLTGPGNDAIDGGPDLDTVDYGDRRLRVVINLRGAERLEGTPVGAGSSGNVWDGESDRLAGIESAAGGAGDDLIYGNSERNELYGNGGADTIYGYYGFDIIMGGDGNDILHSNESDDASDSVYGGAHSGSPGDICHVMEYDNYHECEIMD